MDNGGQIKPRALRVRDVVLYLVVTIIAVAAPPVIWRMDLPIVRSTYGARHIVWELLGMTGTAAILLITCQEIRRTRSYSFVRILPILLFLLVGFHYLIYISEHSEGTGDYMCYFNAGNSLTKGANPYLPLGNYIYPPLPAQMMALAEQGAVHIMNLMHAGSSAEYIHPIVFYMYQCVQFMLLLGAYWLIVRLLRRLNAPPLTAAILTTALFLCNNPLLRTIRFNQMNLWILDCLLIAVLMADRRPWLSGLFIALGSHIKLYPAAMGYPWVLTRRIRCLLGCLIGFAVILALQFALPGGIKTWHQFLMAAGSFPTTTLPRDNSLHSLIFSTFLLGRFVGLPVSVLLMCAKITTLAATGAAVVWYITRSRQRERLYRLAKNESTDPDSTFVSPRVARDIGHLADTTAFMLLVSPLVWEHHYVLAMPLIVWAIAAYSSKRPWLIGSAVLFILAVPTFDMWPFSYNRIAGLLMLLYATPPAVNVEAGCLRIATAVEERVVSLLPR